MPQNTQLDRPFLDYHELLNKLNIDYNIVTDNDDFALNILSTVSYYDLKNGYKECIRANFTSQEPISIERLFQFLIFDKNIQMVLLKYGFFVENFFRTKFSHFLGKNFGADINDYLDSQHYNVSSNRKLKKFNKVSQKIRAVTLPANAKDPTKHYLENHNHLPPWILMKNTNFYDIIELFKLLPQNNQKDIINNYFDCSKIPTIEETVELFLDLIGNVRSFRNKIAHNFKVITFKSEYNINLVHYRKIAPYQNLITDMDIKNLKGKNDLMAMILAIATLLKNPVLEIQFFRELNFALTADLDFLKLYETITGLPKNFNKRLIQNSITGN